MSNVRHNNNYYRNYLSAYYNIIIYRIPHYVLQAILWIIRFWDVRYHKSNAYRTQLYNII